MAEDQAPPLVFRSGFSGPSSDLYEAALAGNGTDMKFEVGCPAEVVTAHMSVIRSQSERLDAMLEKTCTREKRLKEEVVVKLWNYPKEFKWFLKYLYGCQDLTVSNFDVAIVVWKLAEQYRANHVLSLMEDYFEFLTVNMARVDFNNLASEAIEHDCEILFYPVANHLKKNLHCCLPPFHAPALWNRQIWWLMPEDVVIKVLSTDSVSYMGPPTTDWGENENRLLMMAILWLQYHYPGDTVPEAGRETAKHILQCIRFLELSPQKFQYNIKFLHRFLDAQQIGIITLAYGEVSDEDILKNCGPNLPFKVDRRKRLQLQE